MAQLQDSLNTQSGVPLHVQLREILKAKIERGELKSGELLPSGKELATQYGLSLGTISQACHQLVSDGLLLRERGKGTVILSPSEKNITEKKYISFILLNCDMAAAMVSDLVQAVQPAAHEVGYEAIIYGKQGFAETDEMYHERVISEETAGAVLVLDPVSSAAERNHAVCDRFDNLGIPFVLTDLYLPERDAYSVCSDNFSGGEMAGRYLRQMGHTNIATLTDCDNSSVRDRFAGLRNAFSAGEAQIASFLFDVGSQRSFENALDHILALSPTPTAIFASCDWIAVNVLRSFNNRKITIPEKMSVLGYDDLEFVQFLTPPLTTIAQDFRKIGHEAVRLLADVINQRTQGFEQIRLPVQFIERGSVQNISINS